MNKINISVVIPVRDEEKTIQSLLDSLMGQSTLPDEVIIVDGGSTDGTKASVETYISKGYSIRMVTTDHAYPGEARNLGVQHARHDIIAFTDAGIRLDPQWLEKLSEPLKRDPSVDVVYGTYEPITDSFFKECAALAYVPAPANRNGCLVRGPSLASSLMKKSVWEAVGGFPPYRASEDLIFMEAIERNGCKIAYAPEAIVYWEIPPDWNRTFRRFAVYSYHNLLAGRGRYWHKGVVRQYLLALPLVALGLFHHPLWLLAPFAGFLARVGWTLWRKRNGFEISNAMKPRRWAMVGLILLLLDVATFTGAINYYIGVAKSKLNSERDQANEIQSHA